MCKMVSELILQKNYDDSNMWWMYRSKIFFSKYTGENWYKGEYWYMSKLIKEENMNKYHQLTSHYGRSAEWFLNKYLFFSDYYKRLVWFERFSMFLNIEKWIYVITCNY